MLFVGVIAAFASVGRDTTGYNGGFRGYVCRELQGNGPKTLTHMSWSKWIAWMLSWTLNLQQQSASGSSLRNI